MSVSQCDFLEGAGDCEEYATLQNMALTNNEKGMLPKNRIIRLKLNGVIHCFDVKQVYDWLMQNPAEMTLSGAWGQCSLSASQRKRIIDQAQELEQSYQMPSFGSQMIVGERILGADWRAPQMYGMRATPRRKKAA